MRIHTTLERPQLWSTVSVLDMPNTRKLKWLYMEHSNIKVKKTMCIFFWFLVFKNYINHDCNIILERYRR